MLGPLVLAIALAAALFVGYLFLRAYYPGLGGFGRQARKRGPYTGYESEVPASRPAEAFEAAGAPTPTRVNTPAPAVPAPAPLQTQDAKMPERVVSPGGPSPPNAAASEERGRPAISPEAAPLDPYADSNMEAPVHDSMRHPELSFGPGVDNTGMNKLGLSGVGSAKASMNDSPFSPEFAQNGASFMGDIGANDLTRGSAFAMA